MSQPGLGLFGQDFNLNHHPGLTDKLVDLFRGLVHKLFLKTYIDTK